MRRARATARAEGDWPRHLVSKTLASGARAYYWQAPTAVIKAGFTLKSEALGQVYSAARDRALLLNAHLDAWRGRSRPDPINASARTGTVDWWIETFQRGRRFKRLSERSQSDYRKALDRLADIETGLVDSATGIMRRLGELPVSSISPTAADKIYDKLRRDGTVTRQANYAIDVARVAWKDVARQHPGLFLVPVETPNGIERLSLNPWVGILREAGGDTATPATRAEAYALADALADMGHPALGIAALIAFEWHQRPANILSGHFAWPHWRPAARPHHVEIEHHKTGARLWMPLDDLAASDPAPLFPELEGRLAKLPRLGVAVVLMTPQKGAGRKGPRTPRLYSESHAQHLVQKARKNAKLPTHITLEACRHGGLTELGDAEITEQGVMALSGHKTPSAARLYVKKTDRQRVAAARKRRAFIASEGNGNGT